MMDASSARTTEELARLLRQASRELDERVTAVLGETGVSRWHVLCALQNGRGVPMSALAEATPLTGASFTRLIDAMVADNLVLRKVDPLDRRRVLVFRTRRGTLAGQRMHRALRAGGLEVIANDAERLRHDLTALLGRLRSDDVPQAAEMERTV